MHSGFTLSRFSAIMVERPSLDQFVLLSMMLHVLVIVLFGDTAGGGARRGEKIWGALTVTVRSLLPDTSVGLKLDRSVAQTQRSDPVSRPAPASPGTITRNREVPAAAPAEVTKAANDPAPPAQAPSFEMPPVISKDVEKSVTDFIVPKPTIDRAFTPPAQQPSPAPAPPEVQAVPPPPVPPPIIAPKIEPIPILPTPIITPVETKPREVPVVAPPPVPVPAPMLTPAPTPEPPAPKVEREIVKPVAALPEPKPREVVAPIFQPSTPAPAIPAAPVASVQPRPERENIQSVSPPVEVKPREIPAAASVAPPTLSEPPPRVEAPKAPRIEREVVAPSAPTAAPTAPPSSTRVPAGNATAEKDALKPRGDVGTSLPDATGLAPASKLGGVPVLDLDAVRKRARELNSGSGPRTVFPFPAVPPQKPKDKVQQAFDKALKKNDCRDAYADMGLAAVVPLVISAVRDDGCKW